MNEKELQGIVLRVVLGELAKAGERFVPVMSSNRHVHLSQEDVERLFGAGYRLTKLRDLVQPGQYACNETVTFEAGKGKLTLRVVGPVRKETQVELSYTDCYKLGVSPALRMSGDTAGTPGCTLIQGERRAIVPRGVIVAKRHLHLSPEEAAAYGLRDGDLASLEIAGDRPGVLRDLVVRSGPEHLLEAHIDKDEANACGITDGQLCRLLIAGQPKAAAIMSVSPVPPAVPVASPKPAAPETKTKLLDLTQEPRCLIAEEQVLSALRGGYALIRHRKDAVVTPLARDLANAKGIEFIEQT